MTQTTSISIKTVYRSYNEFPIHSSTNASPASLLFGNQINLDSGILSPFPQVPKNETSASKVICEMYNIQDTLIAQAQTALRTMDEAHIATSPRKSRFSLSIHMCWLNTPHSHPHDYTRCGGDRYKL